MPLPNSMTLALAEPGRAGPGWARLRPPPRWGRASGRAGHGPGPDRRRSGVGGDPRRSTSSAATWRPAWRRWARPRPAWASTAASRRRGRGWSSAASTACTTSCRSWKGRANRSSSVSPRSCWSKYYQHAARGDAHPDGHQPGLRVPSARRGSAASSTGSANGGSSSSITSPSSACSWGTRGFPTCTSCTGCTSPTASCSRAPGADDVRQPPGAQVRAHADAEHGRGHEPRGRRHHARGGRRHLGDLRFPMDVHGRRRGGGPEHRGVAASASPHRAGGRGVSAQISLRKSRTG